MTILIESRDQQTARVRDLNDAFRRKLPRTGKSGRLNATAGVAALTQEKLALLLISVREFTNFSADNDPHGEHDFGAIDQDGVNYFWKLDTYDQWMQFGSPDPADPSVTTRVSRSCAPTNIEGFAMKKRYWIIGGIALVGVASLAGGGHSAASLCSQAATKAVIDQEFISKLSGLGARLSDDFTVHGKQGEAVVCSVSFELSPLTKERVAQMDKDYKEPTNAAEAERQALTSLMLPNLLVNASVNPGQPLIQRISYRANRTLDGRVLVEVLNFPGGRGSR